MLERCVAEKIKLTQFEPKQPTLHEAFVELVGDDVRASLEADMAKDFSQNNPAQEEA